MSVEERLKLLLENKKQMEEEILKHKTVERENEQLKSEMQMLKENQIILEAEVQIKRIKEPTLHVIERQTSVKSI